MESMLGPGVVLLNKYRIDSMLGRGGMGVVVKAMHLQLAEEIAIKVLLPEFAVNPDAAARFLREAQSAVRLRGEHVARISDVGVLPEGVPFMVMEYLRGIDLCGELTRRTTLPSGEAVDYALQACEALAEAHAQGIIHRDIKPANLFLTSRPDGTPLVKVLDFGISKNPLSTGNTFTKTDVVMGTPGYMSPEQMKAARDVDARTDIWALGVVLYECLGGQRPFNGDSFSAIVLKAGTEPPPPLSPKVPRGLQNVVLKCLEKDRRARFPSIALLAEALAPFAQNHHEAKTIVGRTSLLLKRPSEPSSSAGASVRPALHSIRGQEPATTLSGSAGAIGLRPRRRRAIVGGALLLGIAALISFAIVKMSRYWIRTNTRPSAEPVLGEAIHVNGGDRRATTMGSTGHQAEGASGMEVVETPGAAMGLTLLREQRDIQCAAYVSLRRWHDLLGCASDLKVLGISDRAQRFRDLATGEAVNEVTDRKARQALAITNVKEAETLLKQMPIGSVYYKSLNDLFEHADLNNVETSQNIADIYLKAHDCSGLKLYAAQDTTAFNTERVLAVFNKAILACDARARPK